MDPRKPKSGDNKNLMAALLVSMAVLLAFEYFMPKDTKTPTTEVTSAQEIATGTQPQMADGVAVPNAPTAVLGEAEHALGKVAQKTERVRVESGSYSGTVALTGGRIDDLVLPDYDVVKGEDEKVFIFSNDETRGEFFDAGWQSLAVAVPSGQTEWKAMSARLTPSSPLVLSWENTDGQRFERVFEIEDDSYVIRVKDSVQNLSDKPVQLAHYAQLHKKHGDVKKGMYDPERSTFFRFLGPQAYFDERKYEMDFGDLKEGASLKIEGRKGWVGMTDRYFISALIPDQSSTNTVRIKHSNVGGDDFYSAILQSPTDVVYPNETREISYRIYAGPQLISEMEKENVHLEEAVDYGWFHFISRPIFNVVMFFHQYVDNMGIAIILGTMVLKLLLFPLANKSYRSMAKMRKIQPKMTRLKEQYGDNREKFAIEMMALYKEHKVNPASGCWPMLIQIPIFFAFYKVILISFPFRHAEFGGWIHNLSDMDPYFVLPILMGVSMFVQQKLSPPATDPIQQSVMKFLPVIFTVMFATFPAGLVLYWLTNNVLSIAQQWYITRQVEEEK